ncbi:hypothetical protein [Brucella thiophenivorans]|uniref:hypothetical protein n=1 Tax=Brucella thiophenivorans TaxID=571255 RepID=UPI00117EDE3B|nr:hypothetical protein [Brucella thiophenivorans]
MAEDGCAYLMGQIYSLRNALRTISNKIVPAEKSEIISILLKETKIYEEQLKVSNDEKFKDFAMGAIDENNRALETTI